MKLIKRLLNYLEDRQDEYLARRGEKEPKGKGVSLETVAKKYKVKLP